MPTMATATLLSNKKYFSSLAGNINRERLSSVVVIGGTAGIGRAMAESFAHHTQGNANIIIVGRNEGAAKEIIDSFPKSNNKAVHVFLRADVTLMSNVEAASAEVSRLLGEDGLDFLILSQGFFSISGRDETPEGLDKKMAVNYYSRWKFIHELITSGTLKNEGAKVLCLGGAGFGGTIDVDDLDMKKMYSVRKLGSVTPTYKDMMMESFASINPRHSFIHAFPGIVRTGLMHSSPSLLLRGIAPFVLALVYFWSVSPEDCAEYMWFGVSRAQPGASRMGKIGEDLGSQRYFGDPYDRQKLWDHTAKLLVGAGDE
jgi:hypothetical protein